MSLEAYTRIRFIDLEASGLGRRSYPIEFGWADIALHSESFLIRPLPAWDDRGWDRKGQDIHGIPRPRLVEEGRDAIWAAEAINAELDGRVVMSDAPDFDGGWLFRLFEDTGVAPRFGLVNYIEALGRVAGNKGWHTAHLNALISAVDGIYPHPHRAGPDALQMAARWRGIVDDAWRAENLPTLKF